MPQRGSGSRQSVARCRTTLPQKQNRTQVRAAPYVVPHCRAYPTTDVAYWPVATDIAAQADVGFRGNCGSGRRSLETSKMTHNGSRAPHFTVVRDAALSPPM